MSDLISREEVLNLIDTAFESGAFDGRYAYENLVDAVQNLIHPLETDLISRQAAEQLEKRTEERTKTHACDSYEVKTHETSDCISRYAARNALLNKGQHSKRYKLGETWELNLMEIEEALGELPSVTPERKPGKWRNMVGLWECDQCHAEYTDMPTCMGKVIYEYCPICGSKMEVDNGQS